MEIFWYSFLDIKLYVPIDYSPWLSQWRARFFKWMALVSGGSARDPLASSVATLVLNKGQERPIFVWPKFIKAMGFFLEGLKWLLMWLVETVFKPSTKEKILADLIIQA